jgi:carbamate kinase
MKTIVIALGGNALLRRGDPMDAAVQRANVKVAAEAVAQIAQDHEVVVTHGNGPQVGLLALQNAAYEAVAPYPLDVLDAETEGMIGYLLEQELGNHLPREQVATLLTQIVVDPDDPAFTHPTKFVGPAYGVDEACRLTDTRGWAMARDGGAYRRVVASPRPLEIVELSAIRLLKRFGVTVICNGGGGIPVMADGRGGLQGVEAVIDKDLAAELLARGVDADALLLLTDVDGVYADYGTPYAHRFEEVSVDALRRLDLPAGSMGPKVDAVCRFVEATGGFAAIGALADAPAILRREAGTLVVP